MPDLSFGFLLQRVVLFLQNNEEDTLQAWPAYYQQHHESLWQGKTLSVTGSWMGSEHSSGDAYNPLASSVSPSFLGQCGLLRKASLAQPGPSFATATAFLSVACEPLVGLEINVVGHDQRFYKKKNRTHEV